MYTVTTRLNQNRYTVPETADEIEFYRWISALSAQAGGEYYDVLTAYYNIELENATDALELLGLIDEATFYNVLSSVIDEPRFNNLRKTKLDKLFDSKIGLLAYATFEAVHVLTELMRNISNSTTSASDLIQAIPRVIAVCSAAIERKLVDFHAPTFENKLSKVRAIEYSGLVSKILDPEKGIMSQIVTISKLEQQWNINTKNLIAEANNAFLDRKNKMSILPKSNRLQFRDMETAITISKTFGIDPENVNLMLYNDVFKAMSTLTANYETELNLMNYAK